MSNIMAQYIAIGFLNILATAVLSYMVYQNDILESKMKKFFLLAIVTTIAIIISEIGTSFFELPIPAFCIPSKILNSIGFSLSPCVPGLLAIAFCNRSPRLIQVLAIPVIINMVLALLSPFYGLIFTISSDNVYSRGPLFVVYMASYIVSMAMLLNETLKTVKRYQNKNRFTLFLLFIFLLIGTSMQIFLPGAHTTWLCVSMAITIYYAYFCELYEKHDALTELFNRRAYECQLQQLQKKASAVIILFDVDDFKTINDCCGHRFGDFCLCTIADNIKTSFHKVGLCYRIGGDEFCVLSENADEDMVKQAVKNFLEGIEHCRMKDPNIPMVSLGYSFYNDTMAWEVAMQEADKQMYCYKQRRKASR